MNFLLAPIFGIARRFYGAKKPWFPSSLNRLVGYALPVALTAGWMIHPHHVRFLYDWIYLLVSLLAIWGGMGLTDYSSYWKVQSWSDWKGMMIEGIFVTAPVGLLITVVSWKSAILCALSGILIAPGYWLGWRMPTINTKFLNKGTEWGELLSWTLIGLTFALAGTL